MAAKDITEMDLMTVDIRPFYCAIALAMSFTMVRMGDNMADS